MRRAAKIALGATGGVLGLVAVGVFTLTQTDVGRADSARWREILRLDCWEALSGRDCALNSDMVDCLSTPAELAVGFG